MRQVACCWELGGGWGHLSRLRAIIDALSRKNCHVTLITPDPPKAQLLLGSIEVRHVAAPPRHLPAPNAPPSLTYGDNLLHNGFDDRGWLVSHLRSWHDILHTVSPDLVVAEHAPSALLAARALSLPRIALGTGFSLPPLVSPMPGLQPWLALPTETLCARERAAVDAINRALAHLAWPTLTDLAGIFVGAEIVLCTVRELDHYATRPPTRYWGPISSSPWREAPVWPDVSGQRVFLYLRSGYAFVRPLLEALADAGLAAVAYLHGEAPDGLPASSRIRYAAAPVDLDAVARDAAFVVAHGGAGTGQPLLLRGTPMLVLPVQLEQAVWAHRITSQKLAEMVSPFEPRPDFASKLAALMRGRDMSPGLEHLRVSYAHLDVGAAAIEIADRCVELAGDGGRRPTPIATGVPSAADDIAGPDWVRVDASTACQLRCPLCPTTTGQGRDVVGRGFLRAEDFRRLLDTNRWIRAVELGNWGEVFLNPELPAILQAAAERAVAVDIDEGANLNAAPDAALEALVTTGVRIVRCAVDGASNPTYRTYRRGGDLRKVVDNVKRINHFKATHQSELPKLILQFIVFGHNEHEIEAARVLAAMLDMEPQFKLNWSPDSLPVRDAERVRSLIADVDRPDHLSAHGTHYFRHQCYQLWNSPQVNWDGKLLGCTRNLYDAFSENVFGSELLDALNSERMRHTRRVLMG